MQLKVTHDCKISFKQKKQRAVICQEPVFGRNNDGLLQAYCSYVTSSFHILASWACLGFWGVIWACQISGSPITHPPLCCLLACAPALMQITGIYEGYFVRCRVETITGYPIPPWCTTTSVPTPHPKAYLEIHQSQDFIRSVAATSIAHQL